MTIFITSLNHVHTSPLLCLSFDHCRWVCHSTLPQNVTSIPEWEGRRKGGRRQRDRETRKASVLRALGKADDAGESTLNSLAN